MHILYYLLSSIGNCINLNFIIESNNIVLIVEDRMDPLSLSDATQKMISLIRLD